MTSPADFPTKLIDGVTVVTIPASLKTISEDEIQICKDVLLGLAEDESQVVIDMSNVEFFGSSFIEVLFRFWNRLKAKDGAFAICSLRPYCVEILSVTNLDTLWTLRDTEEEAIAAIKSAGE